MMLDTLTQYPDDASRLAAVRRRDTDADGVFFYSVATTGVYCHPSCAARPALERNIGFHANRAAAERAGFRACRRCRPDLPPRAEREAALVADACRSIEASEEPPALAALAAEAGVSPHHFHRLFRRLAGVTPMAYAAARRQARVQAQLTAGAGVTEALYDAGFNSSGRFYEAAGDMLGMTPSRYRAGAPGEIIRFAAASCSLGQVLVAATETGICAILLGDDPVSLEADLRRRFPKAQLVPGEDGFAEGIAEVVNLVERPGPAFRLPLDIRGTAFQRRVWEVLRAIPRGETLTYTEVAAPAWCPPRGARRRRGLCGECAGRGGPVPPGDCRHRGAGGVSLGGRAQADPAGAGAGVTSLSARVAALDWPSIAGDLERGGSATTGPLLSPAECDALVAGYADAGQFRSRVVMARHGYGSGEYQYYAYPLPTSVEALRTALYPPLAAVANRWAAGLGLAAGFPPGHAAFLERCHAAGQVRPTPLLLQYGPGDYNCLHQDLYGELHFPLQAAFLLSRPGEDFTGGEFVLTEQRPRMQSRAEVVALKQGEAVIFAVNQRPVAGHPRHLSGGDAAWRQPPPLRPAAYAGGDFS